MTRHLPLCLLLLACSREPGGDPLRLVPGDVGQAAVAPSLALLQARTSAFLAGIEGASGALELLADRFGLDLRTPEGPAALGLDVDKAIAVFSHGPDRAWVGVVSVADAERFLDGARSRLEKGAGATLAAGQPDEAPEGGAWLFDGAAATSPPGPPGWHAALGVTRDRVGMLVIGSADSDVIAHWNALAQGRLESAFTTSDVAARAKAAVGSDAVVYLVLEGLLPNAPRQLGLLRGVVQSLRDSLPTFAGGVAFSGAQDRIDSLRTLRLSAAHVGDGILPVSWVRPQGSPDGLAKAFPKTTTGFLRLRVELGNVRSLPGFIRDNVLPDRLPGLEALPLPTVSDLVDLVDGDVAVGLLGLDVNANLAHLSSLVAHPERALSIFHVALAARVRDAAQVKRTFAGIASQLETSGWTVAKIGGSGANVYEGWSMVRDAEHYAVLVDEHVVLFIIGAGEVDGFLAVKDGRALSLAAFAEQGSATVKQALGQEGGTPLGLALTPLRLSRELSARGLPPYFLKIINDVRLLSATVGAEEKRLDLGLEIGL